MLPIERLQNILEDIRSGGVTNVAALSQKYGVSSMTIRRDLKELENQGLITRTHGGAVSNGRTQDEPQFTQKQGVHQTEKRQIARYAVENFVRDHDIISLEGGTTVAGMVAHLQSGRNLTVMTHGLHTLFELQRITSGNTIISTGGILRDVSNTMVGPVAERHFTEFNASRVFLSATGWTATNGFTDPNLLETQVKKAMIRSARSVIMLLDSSKFGVISLTSFLEPFAVDVLITDSSAPPDIIRAFERAKVDVRIAS